MVVKTAVVFTNTGLGVAVARRKPPGYLHYNPRGAGGSAAYPSRNSQIEVTSTNLFEIKSNISVK